jgi:ABC-type proline/glycine betaine transport system permease subunit
MALPALFFLILTPFALILKQDVIAENLAIYAYYFLVMTTIMGVREIRKEN